VARGELADHRLRVRYHDQLFEERRVDQGQRGLAMRRRHAVLQVTAVDAIHRELRAERGVIAPQMLGHGICHHLVHVDGDAQAAWPLGGVMVEGTLGRHSVLDVAMPRNRHSVQ
jgi:hypothetical protein